MTSGVYPRQPGVWAGNGGRRRSVRAKLTYEQVLEADAMRAKGTLCKVICGSLGVSRRLLWQALNRKGAYVNY